MSRTTRKGAERANRADKFPRSLMVASRVLMGLMALLLFVAPWTEHFGTFDNFPHGQDFELSLLAFLALLCLVLLLAQRRRGGLKDLFAVRSSRPRILWKLGRIPEPGRAPRANACHSPPLPSPSLCVYNLPLQI